MCSIQKVLFRPIRKNQLIFNSDEVIYIYPSFILQDKEKVINLLKHWKSLTVHRNKILEIDIRALQKRTSKGQSFQYFLIL